MPAIDDTTGRNELNITTVDDEKADDLLLAPTFARETDNAAGIDVVNASIGGDEEIDGLLPATIFAPSPVCYALLYSKDCAHVSSRKFPTNKNYPSTMLEIIPL